MNRRTTPGREKSGLTIFFVEHTFQYKIVIFDLTKNSCLAQKRREI